MKVKCLSAALEIDYSIGSEGRAWGGLFKSENGLMVDNMPSLRQGGRNAPKRAMRILSWNKWIASAARLVL